MSYFISQSTGGLYLGGVHGDMPNDAIEITDDQYQAFKGQHVVWDAKGNPSVYDPSADPAAIPRAIAARRYQAEVRGITVGGMAVATDRDSQGLVMGAAFAASLDPNYTCNWKTDEGFVKLDAKTLISVAQAVRAHVQACFDREAMLLTAANLGSYTESMLEEGWPA